MIAKALAALLTVAVLSALGLWWKLDSTSAKLASAEAVVARLEGEVAVQTSLVAAGNKAATRHARERALSDKQHMKELNALSAALVRNPDWAGGDVPLDVSAALGVQPPPQAR